MSKPHILISIATGIDTANRAFGRSFIQGLIDQDSRLTPELVSTSERFKDPYIDLDHFLDEWWAIPIKMGLDGRLTGEHIDGPMWKRKSALVSRGMVNHGIVTIKGRHLPSKLWFESRWDRGVNFAGLFRDWVSLAKPDIGMLHLFTDTERASLKTEDGSWFETGSFGGPAKPGLPDIGWAMAYGEEYASEVDAAGIRAAGFSVDEIDGVTIVRVTDSISVVADNFAAFAKRRAELKRLFRPGLFWIEDKPG